MITFSNLGKYGRFGNQLFQIASTIGIALSNNQHYAFPEWEYSKYFKNTLPTISQFQQFQQIYEKEFTFQQELLCNLNIGDYNLFGYFQSELYFSQYKNTIRNIFTPIDTITQYLNDKYDLDSCAIHIRRGDYLNLPNHHPILSIDYYTQALNIINPKKIYVFTDDREWCKSNLQFNFNFSEENNFIYEFFLMNLLNYHIIANSSFSWWGAWLSNSSKIIAPKKWFGQLGPNSKDIYCNNWETI